MKNKKLAIKIISHMPFTALDYISNKELLLAQAIKEYSHAIEKPSDEDLLELSAMLESSFDERKHLSVCSVDMPYFLKNGSYFRFCISDTLVEGQVKVSPKCLSVEITKPFSKRSATSSLAMLAPIIWTVEPIEGSEANEIGRNKAISLLTDLYYTISMEKC